MYAVTSPSTFVVILPLHNTQDILMYDHWDRLLAVLRDCLRKIKFVHGGDAKNVKSRCVDCMAM